jgi:transcriptional regulator with XRE-family HTH domain
MSDKRHFSVNDLKSIGLRIKACRILTGLNQEEFAKKHSFALPSVKSWEFGRVVPRVEGLNKLIDSLRVDDIFVKINWLLSGEGTGPSFFLESSDENNSNLLSNSSDNSYLECFKSECKKKKQNPIIAVVNDDEMLPYYRSGDIVAGILMSEDALKSNNDENNALLPMLSFLPAGNYAPRWVHFTSEGIYMSSIKNPRIKKLDSISIGKICLHLHS